MKKIALSILTGFFILILTCIACSPLNKSIEKKQSTVKLLSYNVRNCRGMDDITDYQRIANVITRVAPDIVALQELDSATQRSNGIVVLNELAFLTNMYKTYGASIAYQGGKYGIGILTKEKPIKWEVVALPGREERRSLLIVELNDYLICCTHFSLTEEDRIASVEIINEALKDFSKPVFLAGDFNALPGSDVIKNVENNWLMLNNPELPTIPSNNPQRCIDYIFAAKFTGNTFQTKQTIVEQEPVASDHLPVWVEVEIK
ncbi:MAG: endonuclease/exonuclease/phosphatase family protein [Bacteroidales bacterium]